MGKRLCFLSASRRIDRCVVAVNGSEGCECEVKKSVSETAEVVGSVKGNGIVRGEEVRSGGGMVEQRWTSL